MKDEGATFANVFVAAMVPGADEEILEEDEEMAP